MCDDMRTEIRRLVEELQISHAEIVRRMNALQKYRVDTSEFSKAMNGLNTPKSNRMLTDALSILMEEKLLRKALLDAAKRL